MPFFRSCARTLASFCSGRYLCSKTSERTIQMNDEFDLISKSYGVQSLPSGVHRMLLIHPRLRRGRFFDLNPTKTKLQLDETVTLVNTLPKFKVIETLTVSTDYSTEKKRLWGKGRIERIIAVKEKICATALMIDVDVLSPEQQAELTSAFRVPVFDRYNIVLLIFKLFAKTKEAKLQIQLAEIPYIRQRLLSLHRLRADPSAFHLVASEKSKTERLEILRFREQHLRKCLKAAIEEKVIMRTGETQKSVRTVVAVVGYTNAGKSSLVKRLTGENLYVADRLFATLDTSLHIFRLPSGLPILLADTIGFISNLPTQLLASFQATLNHVANADILLHVEDISNPDYLCQRDVVMKTLSALKIRDELLNSVIRVGNKIDKLSRLPADEPDKYFISCTDGRGFVELIAAIDKKVLSMRGITMRRLKLRPQSEAFSYLYKYSLIVDHFHRPSLFGAIPRSFVHLDVFFRKNLYTLLVGVVDHHFSVYFDVMPIIALQLKANMVNVTSLEPMGDWTKFRWHLKLKCTNCGEEPKHWQYVIEEEKFNMPGSRGNANILEKCKLCGRMNSLEIVKDSFQSYKTSDDYDELIRFDCRGLEPVDFDPRSGWRAVGTESATVFENIDLTEKEWVDYDEKVAEPTEINEIHCRFVLCRKQ
uniref:Hflx-type G domain-containing protein n=1 Tax=Setaria digitata TaxID=48799 RepID=A0A915PU86_9BILA